MRDYSQFDKYLDELRKDVYDQPPDPGHTEWAKDSIKLMPMDVASVLDVGCGMGFLKPEFVEHGVMWYGCTLGDYDIQLARERGITGIYQTDFTFTGFNDGMFDLIYARHSLEHSPFPLLTLMEWYRISTKYLLLVAPAPEYWGWHGKNHYAMMNEAQLWALLERSGWEIITQEYLRTNQKLFMDHYMPEIVDYNERKHLQYPGPPQIVEYRYVCRKK